MASTWSPEHMPSTSPASPPPPVDLRHMSSSGVLSSSPPCKDHKRRASASPHLRTGHGETRLGSRSPGSIPSSPTSVHSSSSAIFERDIEPLMPPSPPHISHPPSNPHRIPRAKATEQLEHSVPSVLDSAAEVLTTSEDIDQADFVAIVSPSSGVLGGDRGRSSSGFASPIGSLRSRSPSPLASNGRVPMSEVLLNIPVHTSPASVLGLQNVSSAVPASSVSARPAIETTTQVSNGDNLAAAASTPAIVTPTSVYISTTSSVVDDEPPAVTTVKEPPHTPSSGLSPTYPPSLTSQTQSLLSSPLNSPISSPSAPLSLPLPLSHPPSPIHVAKKRLSFMAYSDLLSSTPAATQSLSSLTTSASSVEPPPHIPSVSGLNLVNAVHAHQQQNMPNSNSAAPSIHGFSLVPVGGLTHPGKRDSIALLDNMGGEWEREGLGMGLEERLDMLEVSGVSS